MNTQHADDAIRSLYRRLEPQVDAEGFCQTFRAKLASGKSRASRWRIWRVALLACLALAFVAAAGVGVHEALTQLGRPHDVLVITDEPTTSGGPDGAQVSRLSNPYPTPESANSSIPSEDRPSDWAESLGRAILAHYPTSGWGILRAVERAGGGILEVSIGPTQAVSATATAGAQKAPSIRVQVNREESGRLPQEGNPMQYHEFATEHGHGLIMPTSNTDGNQSLLTWFVRPDKLFLRVSVSKSVLETTPSEVLLDQAGIQKLVEYIASIIEMGAVDTAAPATPTTLAPMPSDEARGYLDTLESMWKAAGIPVLGVGTAYPDAGTEKNVRESTHEGDPLPWVTVEIPASVFASSDYSFAIGNIMRQTMVAIRRGVPLKYLGIMQVGEDGTKTLYSAGEVYQLASIPGPEWDQAATLTLGATTERLRGVAQETATTAGVMLESFLMIEDASGRVATVVGTIPDREEVSASVGKFWGPLEEAVRQLNKEGAKISGLNVKVDDLTGAPVLVQVLSLNVGGGSGARWLSPQLEAILGE